MKKISNKDNIDFASSISSRNSYTSLDFLSEVIYSILIKFLFFKRNLYTFLKLRR